MTISARARVCLLSTAFVVACLTPLHLLAEPYFAVMTGYKCTTCHVNATGGGLRTAAGSAFGQVTMPVRVPSQGFWDGQVMEFLKIGANFRGDFSHTRVPNQGNDTEFDVEEGRVYVQVPLIKNRLMFYLDQQVSPSSDNREAFAMLNFWDSKAYVKAGKIYLPYGLRLEDDTEFIRSVVGINMTTSDEGVEAGVELGPTQLIFAVSNGTAGGAENDDGKQYSLLASYVRRLWRIGASANYNDADAGDRVAVGGFAGLKTGPISWLGEVDYIDDDGLGPDGRKQWVGFAEGNWLIRKGHNLKLTYGGFDPDDDVSNDDQTRVSVVYEYFPISYTQIRAGARFRDGISQNDEQNTDLYFLQLNVYF